MERHELERSTHGECFLTSLAHRELPLQAAARVLFAGLADRLAGRCVLPFQEKVYGSLECQEEVLAIRREMLARAGLDPDDLPVTWVDGRPGQGAPLVGLQLWGVVPSEGTGLEVSTVDAPGGIRGRLLAGPGFRMLHLAGVRGTDEDGRLADGVTAQGERMFLGAEAALARHGFAYTDVARTWIYLRRILDWYGEFNRVRTVFHGQRGITGGAERPFPASTGIQGTGGPGEECQMDMLALQAENGAAAARPMLASGRQQLAFDYGSGFSRGMTLSVGEGRTVLVSGTASIGNDGETLYVGQRDPQVMQTLLSIASLLESEGGSLADVCQGTVFYKDEQTLRSYREVTGLLGVPKLPLVPVLADVCRPDLLVEIEAVALMDGPGPKEVST